MILALICGLPIAFGAMVISKSVQKVGHLVFHPKKGEWTTLFVINTHVKALV